MMDLYAQIQGSGQCRSQVQLTYTAKTPRIARRTEEQALIDHGFLQSADMSSPGKKQPAWTLDSVSRLRGIRWATPINPLQGAESRFYGIKQTDLN